MQVRFTLAGIHSGCALSTAVFGYKATHRHRIPVLGLRAWQLLQLLGDRGRARSPVVNTMAVLIRARPSSYSTLHRFRTCSDSLRARGTRSAQSWSPPPSIFKRSKECFTWSRLTPPHLGLLSNHSVLFICHGHGRHETETLTVCPSSNHHDDRSLVGGARHGHHSIQ